MKKMINSSFAIISFGIVVFFASCSAKNSSAGSHKLTEGIEFPDNSGLYPIIQDSLFGYINAKGEVIIKPQFEKAAQFSEGLAYFEKGGKYGFINTKGEVVIKPVYETPKYGWFVALQPTGNSYFREGLAVMKKNGLFGYINQKGEEIIPAKFASAEAFSQGLAVVRDNNAACFINKKGEKQFGRDFESAHLFSDSLAAVKIDGKWGYINLKGKLVIPNSYYSSGMFTDGYTVVRESREKEIWKLINKKGKVLLEKPYRMNKGAGNYIFFNQDRNEGFLDLKGNVLLPAKYDLLFGMMGNTIIAKEDSKEKLFGLINLKGEWILKPQYEWMSPAGENMIIVGTKDRELGYVDFTGKVIWIPTK